MIHTPLQRRWGPHIPKPGLRHLQAETPGTYESRRSMAARLIPSWTPSAAFWRKLVTFSTCKVNKSGEKWINTHLFKALLSHLSTSAKLQQNICFCLSLDCFSHWPTTRFIVHMSVSLRGSSAMFIYTKHVFADYSHNTDVFVTSSLHLRRYLHKQTRTSRGLYTLPLLLT